LTGLDDFHQDPSIRHAVSENAGIPDFDTLACELMRNLLRASLLCAFFAGPAACHDDPVDTPAKPAPVATLDHVQQITPPKDIAAAPADAIRLSSGVAYKKLISNDAGALPHAEDTALVQYTAWRGSGETFFTSKTRNRPIAVRLSSASSAFSEVLPLLRKGETVRVWAPRSRALPEGVVYEIEMIDIVRPAVAKAGAPDRNNEQNTGGARNGSADQHRIPVPNSPASASMQPH
jgi:hypothetical protein